MSQTLRVWWEQALPLEHGSIPRLEHDASSEQSLRAFQVSLLRLEQSPRLEKLCIMGVFPNAMKEQVACELRVSLLHVQCVQEVALRAGRVCADGLQEEALGLSALGLLQRRARLLQ